MPLRPFDLNNQFPKRIILASTSELATSRQAFVESKLYNTPIEKSFPLPDVVQAEDKTKDLSWYIASIGITPNAINNPPSGENLPAQAALILKLTTNYLKMKQISIFGTSHNDKPPDDQIIDLLGANYMPPKYSTIPASITSSMWEKLRLTDKANLLRIALHTKFEFSNVPGAGAPNPNTRVLTDAHKVIFTPAAVVYDASMPAQNLFALTCAYNVRITHVEAFDIDISALKSKGQIIFSSMNETNGTIPPQNRPDDIPTSIAGTIFDKWSNIWLPSINAVINDTLKANLLTTKQEYFLTRADLLSSILESGLLKDLFTVNVPNLPDDLSLGIDVLLKEGGSIPLGTLLLKNPQFTETLQSVKKQLQQYCEIYMMEFFNNPDHFWIQKVIQTGPFVTTGGTATPTGTPTNTNFSLAGVYNNAYAEPVYWAPVEKDVAKRLNFPWNRFSNEEEMRSVFYHLTNLMAAAMYNVLIDITSVDYLVLSFNSSFEKISSATPTTHEPKPSDFWTHEDAILRPNPEEVNRFAQLTTLMQRPSTIFDYLTKTGNHRQMNLILWLDNDQDLTLNIDSNFLITPSIKKLSTPIHPPVPIIIDFYNENSIQPTQFYAPILCEQLHNAFVSVDHLRLVRSINAPYEFVHTTQTPNATNFTSTDTTLNRIDQHEYELTHGEAPGTRDAEIVLLTYQARRTTLFQSTFCSVEPIKNSINLGKYISINYLWRLFYRVPREIVDRFESEEEIWSQEICWRVLSRRRDNIPILENSRQPDLTPFIPNRQHEINAMNAVVDTEAIFSWRKSLYPFYSSNVPQIRLFSLQNMMIGLSWIDLNLQAFQTSTLISTEDDTNSRAFATRIFMKPESRSFIEHANVSINKCFRSARGMHTISEIQLSINDPSNRHNLENALIFIELEINQEDIDENASDPQDQVPWAPSDPATLEHLLSRSEAVQNNSRNLKRSRKSY